MCVCVYVSGVGSVVGELANGSFSHPKMSSSDYNLRQFSNYSVKHQSSGLEQVVLVADGQCNHYWASNGALPLSLRLADRVVTESLKNVKSTYERI